MSELYIHQNARCNDKKYSSLIVNLLYKYRNLKLKYMNSESYHEKRTATSLSCLNHLSSSPLSSLHSGFRDRFVLNSLYSKALTTLVLFFQTFFFLEFTIPNSRHNSAFFFFLFSICRINLTFPSTLKTFLLFVIVAML